MGLLASPEELFVVMIAAFAAGLLGSILGGAGVVLYPVLVLVYGPHAAVAMGKSSVFVGTHVVSATRYARAGVIETDGVWLFLSAYAVACLLGTIGAHLVPGAVVELLLAAFLFASAVRGRGSSKSLVAQAWASTAGAPGARFLLVSAFGVAASVLPGSGLFVVYYTREVLRQASTVAVGTKAFIQLLANLLPFLYWVVVFPLPLSDWVLVVVAQGMGAALGTGVALGPIGQQWLDVALRVGLFALGGVIAIRWVWHWLI